MLRDPHPQRLRHRRPRPGPGDRRGVPRQRRRPRSPSTGRRSRDGEVVAVGRPDAGHALRHPRPHLHPPVLRPGRRAARARSASSPAARCCTAPPAAPTCSAPSTPHDARPPPARLGPPAGRPAARRRRGATRPTASAASARPPSPTRPPPPSATRSRPTRCSRQDEETYVDELLGRPGRLPRLLRPHGAGQRRRPGDARPHPAAPRPTPSELRRRIEAGEWVVDLRNRTAFAAGHVPGTAELRARRQLRHLPRLADPVGHPAHAARRDRRARSPRPSASWSASASTGRPPTPPAARRTGPTATLAVPDRHLRRPRARCATTATWSSSTSAAPTSTPTAHIDGAVNIPLHELPGRLDEVPDGEVWVHCAGGYRASIAASLLDAAGRTVVVVDDNFDNAEKVGLHLVGADGVTLLTVAGGRRRRALIGLSLGALGGGGSILAVPVLVLRCSASRPRRPRPGRWSSSASPRWSAAVTARPSGTSCSRAASSSGRRRPAARSSAPRLALRTPERRPAAAPSRCSCSSWPSLMAVRGHRAGAGPPEQQRSGLDDPIITFSPTFACACPRALKVLVTATVGRTADRLPRRGRRLPRRAGAGAVAGPRRWPSAAGTSLVVIVATSTVALLARLPGDAPMPDWGIVLALTAAAVVGALAGVRTQRRL